MRKHGLAVWSLLLIAGCGGSSGPQISRTAQDALSTGGISLEDLSPALKAKAASYSTRIVTDAAPTTFDGRSYAGWMDANGNSCLTAPWTQGDTSFCWAFSSSTAASDRYRIANRSNPTGPMFQTTSYPTYDSTTGQWNGPSISVTNGFAPIAVGECGIEGATDGCKQGGHAILGFDYLYNDGGPLLAQWGQYACSGTCPSFSGVSLYKSGTPYYVTPSDPNNPPPWTPAFTEDIENDIYAHGPLAIGFKVPPGFKTWWKSSASSTDVFGPEDTGGNDYNEPSEYASLKGHAVVLVGWGTQGGQDYWIVRNSWGQTNGDSGYFKMAKGLNFCNMEQNAVACDPGAAIP